MLKRPHQRWLVLSLSMLLLPLAACTSNIVITRRVTTTPVAPTSVAGGDRTTVVQGAVTAAVPRRTATESSIPPTSNKTIQSTATPGLLPATAGQPAMVTSASMDLRMAIRGVSQLVKPSVVQITNVQQVRSRRFSTSFTVPAGVGSGIIYDHQGHVLTNNHVVQGASQLQVSLPSGQAFPATLVGADPETDLAVVQITGSNLPVATLGDSSKLQVGDWLVAIGNALGLQGGPTVTQGVVSALGRTVQEPADASQGVQSAGGGPFLFDAIQTDTPINPGNSGGPLLNLDGEVIGINTLVAGQSQGIGFAIAINTAKPIADQLVKTGHVVHPSLGLSYVPLNPPIAAQLGVATTDGVVAQDVVVGGPSDQAGIQQGDVITAVDGQSLKGESALAEVLNQHKPGDVLKLVIVRQGQTTTVALTLGVQPQP